LRTISTLETNTFASKFCNIWGERSQRDTGEKEERGERKRDRERSREERKEKQERGRRV
jgi:hypothetical protein